MWTRVLAAVAVLGAVGYLHGRWTDRWGASPAVAEAAAGLGRLPMTVGDWDGRDITRDESEVVFRSPFPQIVRRYVNRVDGTSVGFLLTCGRPGGMIIEHNPKECYGRLGYEQPVPGRVVSVTGDDGRPAEFFAHTFAKEGGVTSRFRLFWAWGDGGGWSFPDRPRLQLGGKPVIYKLYVTRDMTDDEPADTDPAIRFIKAVLPYLDLATNPSPPG